MEKKSNFEKWLDLTQAYIHDCRKTFVEKLGLIDPDKKNEFAAQTDFESCNELTFEGVVAWIQQNMSKVDGSTAAVVRKENLNKSTEDFAYKVEIFFMKDNQVLTTALHKVVLCNFLEDDLAMNFKEVNGQYIFIIK